MRYKLSQASCMFGSLYTDTVELLKENGFLIETQGNAIKEYKTGYDEVTSSFNEIPTGKLYYEECSIEINSLEELNKLSKTLDKDLIFSSNPADIMIHDDYIE